MASDSFRRERRGAAWPAEEDGKGIDPAASSTCGRGPGLLILSQTARQALEPGPLCALEFQHGFALAGGSVRGSVSVSPAGEEGLSKIVVALQRGTAGTGEVIRLEAVVRRSWLQDVVEGADGRAVPAVAIARAIAQIATLAGQRAVSVTVAGEAAGPGPDLAASLDRFLGGQAAPVAGLAQSAA